VAFVGAGPVGLAHLKAFRSLEVEVVGLCTKGADTGRLLAAEHGFPLYAESITELYERTKADAVVAALPIAEMLSAYRELFALPWASLTEKPLGVDLLEAREIAALAHGADHRGFVGFNRRHFASTRAAMSIIETSSAPRSVTVFDQQDRDQALRVGHPSVVAENFMYANSIHLIDYFSMFCRGMLTKVQQVRPWTAIRGCTVEVELTYDSGDVGRYIAVWEQKGPWAVELMSGDINVVLRPLEKLTVTRDGRDVTPLIDYGVDELFKPGFVVQAQSFIGALSGSGGCPTIDDAIVTTELVSSIYGTT
jgi:predicted dehydrogenase